MRRPLFVVLLILLLLLHSPVIWGNSPVAESLTWTEAGLISNETIVSLPEEATFVNAVEEGSYLGAEIINSYGPTRTLRLEYPIRLATSETGFRSGCLAASARISPNYIRRAHTVPDDPKFGLQTYLKPIEIAKAWDLFKGNAGITIAVIDTGIDVSHPDLQGNLIGGINLRPDEDIADIDDPHGHGTAVAGIIGATTDNGEGIAGICWNVRLLVVKVLGGEELTTTLFEEAAAIDYAVSKGARVINMSFGGPGTSSVEKNAITKATLSGTILVASAGNDGVYGDFESAADGLNYPAAYSDVIGVGALTKDLVKANFSNYGFDQCELVAVGKSVYTTLPGGIGDITGPILIGRKYGWATGTSFAAPQVTALAALLIMKEPWLNLDKIKDRLRENATGLDGPDLDGDGVDDHLGYGLIQCFDTLADSPVGRNEALKIGIFASPIFPERVYVYVQVLKQIDEGSLAISAYPETGQPFSAEVTTLEGGAYLGSLVWPPAAGLIEIEVVASSGGTEYPRLVTTYKP